MIAIQAPEHPPAPHPGDRALLRPLSTLGKEQSAQPVASFLRRFDRVTNEKKANRESNAALKTRTRHTPTKTMTVNNPQPARDDPARDDPANILRTIIKGFDIAHPDSIYTGPDTADNVRGYDPTPAELDAWNNPRHPSRKDLKLVNSFPVLPDPQRHPDDDGYILVKFAVNPGSTTDGYDERVEYGILRPLDLRPEVEAAHKALHAAHKADPSKPAPGLPPFEYEFFIPRQDMTKDEERWQDDSDTEEREELLEKVRRKFDPDDPQRNDPALYTSQSRALGQKTLGYKSLRAYETASMTVIDPRSFEEVALTLYDPDEIHAREVDEEAVAAPPKKKKQKGAYIYPIMQRSQIRPRRANVQPTLMGGSNDEDENADLVHRLEVTVKDGDEIDLKKRVHNQNEYDPSPRAEVSTKEDTTQMGSKEP